MADTWDQKSTNPKELGEEEKQSVDNCCPDPANGLPSGTGLGKYRILERTRRTHNAITYKARDTMLDRLVTIKQMNPHLIDDPIGCGEFKREAQLLARVPKDSRHVVNIHELIEGERGLFIVEEHIPGSWLETLISKRQVDATDAIRLLKSACTGLHTLHSRRIVHRDIRPENLLVSKSGLVHIMNLSCTAHEGDISPPPIIARKYAAPELQAERDHDARIDIYALGFVIYEVCVGRRALRKHFANLHADVGTEEQWRQWHTNLEENLPDATALNSTVPPALSSILRRMTAKDLDDRFASTAEILEELTGQFRIQKATARQPTEPMNGVLDLQSAAPGVIQLITRPKPLTAFPNHDQSTSTHAVEPSGLQEEPLTPVRPFYRRVDWPTNRQAQRPMYRSAPPMPLCPIPKPMLSLEVSEPRRRKQWGPLLPAALCVAILTAIFITIPILWDRYIREPGDQSVKQFLAEANDAYFADDFHTARNKLQEVEILSFGNSKLRSQREKAEYMLLLIKGHHALDQDEFSRVEQIIEKAEKHGTDLSALEALRNKYWSKKDAYRLAAEGNEDLKQKRFTNVESKLEEYEKKASEAGLDPSSLKDSLEQTKRDTKYQEALERSRKALNEKDFDAALIACRDADAIKSTSTTRLLFTDIQNAIEREDWLIRGDQAMIDQDYIAAESAYESANEIEPSDDVEQKVRFAAALRLFEEAREAINQGQLLAGERLLENSMWKHTNAKAGTMLERMKPAFEAAKLVNSADRKMAGGDRAEAVRLYQKALLKLPPPTDKIVREKLQRATSQPGP